MSINTKHTEPEGRERKRRRFSYANVVSTLSVFLVVAGGTAFAAGLAPNSVKSKTVKDNSLKAIDLKDGAAVSTDDVIDATLSTADLADNAVTGADVNEATLGQVPDSARLQGRSASSFLSTSVYKRESAIAPGTALGDGTHVANATCNPGDVMLSGGPANVSSTSTLLESFPSPGSTNSWSARINKHGQADNFNVVVLCIDQ
jgi:hypothetical protein